MLPPIILRVCLQRATVQVVIISNGVSTSYVIYNYGDEMTAYKTNYMVGVSVAGGNGASVARVMGRRIIKFLMFEHY